MELIKLVLWFSVIGKRGNRERQVRGPVTLTSLASLLAPHLTLSLGETEKLPELVWCTVVLSSKCLLIR